MLVKKRFQWLNIEILIHCENLPKVSNKIKKNYVKIQSLNLINYIEQVFPVRTAIK